jgi:hypothetical protein
MGKSVMRTMGLDMHSIKQKYPTFAALLQVDQWCRIRFLFDRCGSGLERNWILDLTNEQQRPLN